MLQRKRCPGGWWAFLHWGTMELRSRCCKVSQPSSRLREHIRSCAGGGQFSQTAACCRYLFVHSHLSHCHLVGCMLSHDPARLSYCTFSWITPYSCRVNSGAGSVILMRCMSLRMSRLSGACMCYGICPTALIFGSKGALALLVGGLTSPMMGRGGHRTSSAIMHGGCMHESYT